MKVVVIDVGGSHIKVLATGRSTPIKIPSGPKMTASRMVRDVRRAVAGWKYDAVSIGYPGVVLHGKPVSEPRHLGGGWVGFRFKQAFGCPVIVINDAAMQALGSYAGGRMLFLGLGTGLGSALIIDGVLEPTELAHLPYKKGRTYEDYAGNAGLKRLGKKKWRRHVLDVVTRLKAALEADDVVIGGGNAKLLNRLPRGVRLGANANAFLSRRLACTSRKTGDRRKPTGSQSMSAGGSSQRSGSDDIVTERPSFTRVVRSVAPAGPRRSLQSSDTAARASDGSAAE
jgi:polyphosphate glucokinase